VARAVEHDDHHVAHVGPFALGDEPDRLAQRAIEVQEVGEVLAGGHLLHVHDRARVEHRAPLGEGDDSERVRPTVGGQPRALQRVDRDVHLGRCAVADLLTVVEHRRLVLLPLADDHDAVHVHGVEHGVHAVDRRLVGRLLVAHPHEPGGGQRGGLGHAHELQREVAVDWG
jgi:hypothetical protein